MNDSKRSARHIVVVGGSFAGLAAAYTLRRRLPPEDRITVISQSGHFTFAPSLVWAALGQPLLHSSFALEPALAAHGIEFVRSHVREVRAGERTVVTEEGEATYDRLLIATGGRPDPSSVPGLAGEFRSASWVVGEDSAMEARNVLRRLSSQPGPLIIGAAQGASYISAAYELALALDTALRRQNLRDRIPITFVTAEPYLGHLGYGQTAAMARLDRLFAERGIGARVGVGIEHVGAHEVSLSNGEALPAQASVIMPPFTGVVDIWKSAKLTDNSGLIPINAQYRHVEHEDVYAAGVAAHFTEPVPPLGLARTPHTGYLSVHMGKFAGQNMAASLGSGQPSSQTLPAVLDIRVLDGGNVGLFITSRGREHLHNRAVQLPGSAAHLLKASIERYLVWRLRTGRIGLP